MRYLSLLVGRLHRFQSYPLMFQVRNKSDLGQWDKDLTTEIKIQIEKYWQTHVSEQPTQNITDKQYILSMFPYPSGQLHMGHVRVYSISDTIARYHKLNGKNVIHPMGWDAFGLPAENAAFERNVLPDQWTISNIASMKKQLMDLGFQFDWNREIATCKPEYYKWTQFIFLKMFENGLAYQGKAVINWDPVDKTVLADEQVDVNGCSWRSGAKVEKKFLNQWYIKTTKFAKQLFDGLDSSILVDWKDIINLQKHWIGECNGASAKFSLKSQNTLPLNAIDIWTEQPEKILHGQFITVRPESLLCEAISEFIDERNIIPVVALNPLSGEELPIVVTNLVEYPEGRDVYLASPKTSAADSSLASDLDLQVHFEPLDQETINNDREKVILSIKKLDIGVYPVSSKLKDWLISRQRYWGTPIPIIHCKTCGTVPVPYTDLPVELPKVDSMIPGSSPLANNTDWVNCPCPKCGSKALRETDTMDTFVDSSWYFLRFLDPLNRKKPFESKLVKQCFPVDLYIGGKEHAVLHLYYARFITHFLNSINWLDHTEPFTKLLVQGMVMGKSYRVKSSGKYVPREKVKFENGKAFDCDTAEPIEVQWEKMSKSKHNGENPQELLTKYGCDTTRLFMLADVTPATPRHWSDATFSGVLNWQHRVWLTIRDLLHHRRDSSLPSLHSDEFKKREVGLWNSRNYFISRITYNYKHTHHLSIVISRLQGLTTALRKEPPQIIAKSAEFESSLAALVVMLAPVAPHFACELWAGLRGAPHRVCAGGGVHWAGGVFDQQWPRVDDNYPLSLVCKVDGAKKCELKILPKVLANMSQEEALKLVLEQKQVSKLVQRGISKTTFDNHPGCGASLCISTVLKQKKPTEAAQAASRI